MLTPKIKDWFDVIPEAEDRYQVRSSEVVSIMRGATVKHLLSRLLPLMDGLHTIDEIVDRLSDAASPEVIHGVVAKLIESRFVEDVQESENSQFTPQEIEQYRQQLIFLDISLDQGTPLYYQDNLKKSRLSIIGDGDLASSIASQAARVGIGRILGVNMDGDRRIGAVNPMISFNGAKLNLDDEKAIELAIEQENPDLIVAAFERPEPELLKTINDLSQRLRINLLHCMINGTEGIIGPFVVPGQTACLMCQHIRVTHNLDFYREHHSWERWITTEGKRQRARAGSLAPFTDLVAGMTSVEVFKHLSGFHEAETYGKFITINALTFEVIHHQVLRVPRCPQCGGTRNRPTFSPWQGV